MVVLRTAVILIACAFLGCDDKGTEHQRMPEPERAVSITSPVDGSTVSETVRVAVEVTGGARASSASMLIKWHKR